MNLKIEVDGYSGYWEHYSILDGVISAKGNYVKGRRTGYWENNYATGELHCKGNYVDNKRNGLWFFYGKNGMLVSKEYFK